MSLLTLKWENTVIEYSLSFRDFYGYPSKWKRGSHGQTFSTKAEGVGYDDTEAYHCWWELQLIKLYTAYSSYCLIWSINVFLLSSLLTQGYELYLDKEV